MKIVREVVKIKGIPVGWADIRIENDKFVILATRMYDMEFPFTRKGTVPEESD